MNQVEVKDRLADIVKNFFPGASVIWTEQMNTRPKLPYITLKLGSINRTAFPVEDDEGRRAYQYSTMMELNLYTDGQPLIVEGCETGNRINTATSDLMEFSNYLESDAVVDDLSSDGMGVMLSGPVRDLTELQNTTNYRYRAMAEYAVTFCGLANGMYAESNMPLVPNSSGGGSEDQAAKEVQPIVEVTITEGGLSDEE